MSPDQVNTDLPPVSDQARVTIPGHVVYRTFVTETVALNIETGQYHGLNATAGRMLEELEKGGTVTAAVEPLAVEFEVPAERIRADLLSLCASLRARGLIEVADRDGSG
jgi:hypothetical protein